MSDVNTPVLECRGVSKTFTEGPLQVEVLKNIDLTVAPGEAIAIIGSSGAGKSTLLHILGGLARPTHGQVFLNGLDVFKLKERARGALRNYGMGFVYQFHHLLPEFTAVENVAMPLLIRRTAPKEALASAEDMLTRTGLGARLHHKPGELSGGERQRTAIARALVTQPDCVLADEPTGNLDSENAEHVFELMQDLAYNKRSALVLVTHDHELASRLDRTFQIVNGVLNPL
ncbi:MAG: lipoprotein-releasing system ATP-binding protein LolD [marine bacterium B5-7]|nr:MAG: lipoprotein-releasing system ATP-binding protein LolD [marine bacterium B5-7]